MTDETSARAWAASIEAAKQNQALHTRNVTIGNRRTSMRLEHALWRALFAMAERQNLSVDAMITAILRARNLEGAPEEREPTDPTATSTIRVAVVEYWRTCSDGPDGDGSSGRRRRTRSASALPPRE